MCVRQTERERERERVCVRWFMSGPDPVEYVPAVQRVQSTATAGKVLSADDDSRNRS